MRPEQPGRAPGATSAAPSPSAPVNQAAQVDKAAAAAAAKKAEADEILRRWNAGDPTVTPWAPGMGSAEFATIRAFNPNTDEAKGFHYRGDAQAAEADIARARGLGEQATNRATPYGNYTDANYARQLALSGSRQEQAKALAAYRDAAFGNGPSAAQAQFRGAIDESRRQALSMAAGARGTGVQRAAAQMLGQPLAADAGQRAAYAAAMLRAQEQQQGMAGYMQGSTVMRGNDAAQQAQDAQQTQFDAQQSLAARNANDAARAYYEQQAQGIATTEMQGHQAGEQNKQGWQGLWSQTARDQAGNQAASSANERSTTGAIIGAAGTAIGAGVGFMAGGPPGAVAGAAGGAAVGSAAAKSDERSKMNIEDGKSAARAFMDSLEAKTFDYRDPADGDRRTGVMAQDMERTPIGRAFVSEGPDGYKRVDYGKALGTMLAGEADLHDRVSQLEAALRARAAKRKAA